MGRLLGRSRTRLLFADPQGRVLEHPALSPTLRSGEELVPPQDRPIPLPEGAKLVHLPGRLPVGFDAEAGRVQLLERVTVEGQTFVPQAVGALLPPGFTRTFLPGEVKGKGPVLPQWAYTAAAWSPAGPVVWALHTDRRGHWDQRRYSTSDLAARVRRHRARFPTNRVLEQLQTCALIYRCTTSQNVFYARDEAAIPASTTCNARCVGCISEQPKKGPPASHERIQQGPSGAEMAEVGAWHLERCEGRAMVSFGQGCEGEPLTRWRAIAEAIGIIRAETSRGSININTNASRPDALEALLDAGLDAVRVSLNSATKDLYEAYYQPVGYTWEDVDASMAVARARGAYLALNLLLFPGVTDREGEVDALCELVRRHRVDQVQTRSLCIDPFQYLEVAHGKGAGGEALGVRALLARLKRARPGLLIGNFARGKQERRARA